MVLILCLLTENCNCSYNTILSKKQSCSQATHILSGYVLVTRRVPTLRNVLVSPHELLGFALPALSVVINTEDVLHDSHCCNHIEILSL